MADVILEMKGTAVKTQIEYVRVKFGDDGYRNWVEALSEDARAIVDETVLESRWYKGECAVVELRSKICDVFYDGSPRGAWEL
ncbi:MAG: hypothetical protein GY854_12160, partial [Deltaproteobacteria bacterium]|nr:hypothetical protein [Deltaproteobacteria bacterium]